MAAEEDKLTKKKRKNWWSFFAHADTAAIMRKTYERGREDDEGDGDFERYTEHIPASFRVRLEVQLPKLPN